MSYTKVQISHDPKVNCWEVNEHLKITYPFSKLYETDNGGKDSSAAMWSIIYKCEPDEDENRFLRLGIEGIDKIVEEKYGNVDVEDDLYLECLEAYPMKCLSVIGQSLKNYKEFLDRRAKTLRELSDEEYKSNMKEFDISSSKTGALYEEYKRIEASFKLEKKKARVEGGRAESKSERYEI